MLMSAIFLLIALFLLSIGSGFLAAICLIVSVVIYFNSDNDDFFDDDDKNKYA